MYKTQFHKYRVPWVNYTKLNFINIEFHMKFFIEKSHVTWHFLFTKLEINKIEFYAKSSSKMVVFWYIVYLPIMLFCWKFLKCGILFGQYSSCVSNMSISKVQNFDLMYMWLPLFWLDSIIYAECVFQVFLSILHECILFYTSAGRLWLVRCKLQKNLLPKKKK